MKVLFDQGTPAPLRWALKEHTVETAYERGWSGFHNGALISAAEAAGFDVFVTTDRNLKYQRNLTGRNLAVVVLLTTSWPRIQQALEQVCQAVDQSALGNYIEVNVPNME